MQQAEKHHLLHRKTREMDVEQASMSDWLTHALINHLTNHPDGALICERKARSFGECTSEVFNTYLHDLAKRHVIYSGDYALAWATLQRTLPHQQSTAPLQNALIACRMAVACYACAENKVGLMFHLYALLCIQKLSGG